MNWSEKVILDVGGSIFATTIGTIMSAPNSMLATIVEDRWSDKKEPIFIDRDGSYFRHTLNFLRLGSRAILPESKEILNQLMVEADFYGIQGLVDLISLKLNSNIDPALEEILKKKELINNGQKHVLWDFRKPGIDDFLAEHRQLWIGTNPIEDSKFHPVQDLRESQDEFTSFFKPGAFNCIGTVLEFSDSRPDLAKVEWKIMKDAITKWKYAYVNWRVETVGVNEQNGFNYRTVKEKFPKSVVQNVPVYYLIVYKTEATDFVE